MKDVILIVALICVFAFGYFLVVKLDRFVFENRASIKKEDEKVEPSCVMLADELPEQEVNEQIRRFRESHRDTRIMLYGDEKNGNEN